MRELLSVLVTLFVFPGFGFLVACAFLFEWIDRRTIARLQARVGPPWFQPVADLLKLLSKESVLPRQADRPICRALPVVALAAVLTAALYVPVGGRVVYAFEGDLIVVLFLLSLPALFYFLAGWVSGGVYSILGGSRSVLQYFSYEVPFLMALSAPAILTGSWSISEIITQQAEAGWILLVQPLGFLLAVVGLIGKLKRVPFDIPKAKSEVVGGPLTEFSGRELALWHLAVDVQTVAGIFLLVNVFLGGGDLTLLQGSTPLGLARAVTFAAKALAMLLTLSVTSALYARLRIDQLASLGWRILAPLGLLQLAATILLGVG
ncbi:MAG: NADH-quinone oxidoreductase subunit H [Anaerolineae bacterium]|nr:NADH-quinone oxidoreductase subunit H [Anaerolineae bacterium]